MDAITYKMPKEVRVQSIEKYLGEKHQDIVDYLIPKGFKTMEDIVDHQKEIPQKYMTRNLMMLLLKFELIRDGENEL